MESTTEGSIRRSRFGITLTLARIVMDDVEFKQTYNQAVNHAQRITAPDSKEAVFYILQLLNGLHEMIQEMQVEDEC